MKALILAVLVVLGASALAAQSDPIFNRALETKQISRADARNLYLLKERSSAGERVHVFRMPLRDRLHADFVRDVLAMTPAQFDSEWQKLINAGLAPQIEEARNEREMIALVSRYRGGIGYLSHDFMVLNSGGRDAVIVRIVD
jgi:hypothetical protein